MVDAIGERQTPTMTRRAFFSRAAVAVGGVAAVVGAGVAVKSYDTSSSQEIHFGEPLPRALAKDPQTGKDGIIWRHGSIEELPYHGTIGVGYSAQEPIIRTEPYTGKDSQIVPEKKLEESGVNLKDLWMEEVIGGPYDVSAGEVIKSGDWVKFTGIDKDGNTVVFYSAEKFAKFDGEQMLELPGQNGTKIQVPYTPLNK